MATSFWGYKNNTTPPNTFERQRVTPYHLFTKLGEPFVYVLSTSQFFHIDAPTYRLLDLCLIMPIEDAASQLASETQQSPEEIETIVSEVRFLAANGLFDVPDFSISDDEIERQLDRRYEGPWTKLELALAETCNLACKYCYCETFRDQPRKGLMSKKVAKDAIDWLFSACGNAKKLDITLFGGEPLTNKPVFRFLMDYSHRLARSHGKTIRYSMTTNGTLIDDMVIHYIKKHNFGLMVSLDGPPEIHDQQRPCHNGGGSYAAAAAGIRRLMNRRKRVTVRCTITKDSPPLLDLIRFFDDFGFSRIGIAYARDPLRDGDPLLTEMERTAISRQQDDILPILFEEFRRSKIPKYFPYARFIRSQGTSVTASGIALKCSASHGTITVGADGTLYPCHRFVGMSAFSLGSLETGPNVSLCRHFWHLYNRAVETQCASCWAIQLCRRPCPWDISKATGGFGAPEDWECRLVRASIERGAYVAWRMQKDFPEAFARLLGQGATNETDETDRF